MKFKKRQWLAMILATIPPLGHIYLGEYKRGGLVLFLMIVSFIFQLLIVWPIFISPVVNKYGNDSLIERMVSTFINVFFWVYGWQFRDVYLKAEELINVNVRKVILSKRR
jgi:hypothetical protein